MSMFDQEQAIRNVPSPSCPPWCTSPHDATGEESWLHVGEPLFLTGGVRAQLCLSIDPATGAEDGPYVLIGDTQYTPSQAEAIAARLVALSTVATPS